MHVSSHSFGSTRATGIYCWIRNETEDMAGNGAANANATLPTRIGSRTRFRIGSVQHVVRVDKNSAQSTEMLPFSDEDAILLKNLDAHVAAIGHKQAPLGIECERMGRAEFSGCGTDLASGFEETAGAIIFHDARYGG